MLKHTKSICTFFVVLLQLTSSAQIIGPFSKSQKGSALPLTGGVGANTKFQFMPFRDANQLQDVYDKSKFSAPNSFSLSAIVQDSASAPNTFVEVLSFIPDNGLFKFGLSVQLNATERSDSSATVSNIAVQKLLNNGGNISLSVNRPILYGELYPENFYIIDAEIIGYFDVTKVNQKLYNPGAGVQFHIGSDFRIYTAGSKRQNGNILRVGIRPKFIANAFNNKYQAKYGTPNINSNVAFGILEAYLGLAFFDIRYSRIISSASVFENRRSILEITVIPVKF